MIAATSQLITQNSKIMPYGQAGRLGERIDPRLMQADFSGYANAGMIQGQALAGLGQQIGDAAKQRGQEEKFIKKSEQLAKSIGELIPELQGQAGQALDALNNPDLSHRDRLAMAESIGETLKVGMMSIENQRAKEMMALRRASMAAKGEAAATPISPAQIRAAYEMANAAGRGAPARALVQQYEMAKTPEEEQQIAKMLIAYSGELKPSTVKGESETSPKLTALDQRYDYLRRAYMLKTGKQELTPAEEANLREQAVRLDPMSVVMQQALSGLEDDL